MTDIKDCIVLIVDDSSLNIDLLVATLGTDFNINIAMDGNAALKSVADDPPDLILLDILMPGMDGYGVCTKLKQSPATAKIPIIFLTGLNDHQNESRGLALGAADYIHKPFNPMLVKARVKNHLALKMHQDRLENLVKKRTRQIELTQEMAFKAIGTLVECKDPETGGHIRRTQNYVKLLANSLKSHPAYANFFTDETVDLLYMSAPLHDIGKIGVPDVILLKPTKLLKSEFETIKRHTTYGYRAILASERDYCEENINFMRFAKELTRTHHERWDGSGYPQGLKREEIPISGRLMAVADVYDALISQRVYKPPFKHQKAVDIIHQGKGTHFDPHMVDAFMDLEDQFRQIGFRFADCIEEKENLA
ncbi:Response regulator [Desulforapulum autotrophicum HRM2]|uniref:Response regulator n=1 Tax=Desulforapulum autotrophicum (strain ATCC 43914 / DSM 3382 / VKM B-1955 / HRM2) TaxID=177437 RepID=C0QF47_DESAH|nr:two-component system response regulator [Desulforapulum autotrophicum]ACN17548.1 Response regulator [Desulforapulum autotrophicum HRM2]